MKNSQFYLIISFLQNIFIEVDKTPSVLSTVILFIFIALAIWFTFTESKEPVRVKIDLSNFNKDRNGDMVKI